MSDSLAVLVAARNEGDRVGDTVAALRGAFPDVAIRAADDALLNRRHPGCRARGRGPGRQPRSAPTARGRTSPPPPRRRSRRRPPTCSCSATAISGLGRAAVAPGRRGPVGGVRPRRRGLQAPGRRRPRRRSRVRPLGDPPPLRPRDDGPDLGAAGDGGRGPAGDAAVRGGLRDGGRNDYRCRARRPHPARVRARPLPPGDRSQPRRLRPPGEAATRLCPRLRIAARGRAPRSKPSTARSTEPASSSSAASPPSGPSS